jgi:hypothetical protein
MRLGHSYVREYEHARENADTEALCDSEANPCTKIKSLSTTLPIIAEESVLDADFADS